MHSFSNNSSENTGYLSVNANRNQSNNNGNQAHFTDNRSEVTLQRKLKELAGSNPIVEKTAQLQRLMSNRDTNISQRKENKTGLPENLKNGVENLSGYSLDDVEVHYNSDKPAQVQAHAYAQGAEIHVASGQEKHLPHEAWHVVQQKQGRVKPPLQMKSKVNINDDKSLEKEADEMGAKALQKKAVTATSLQLKSTSPVMQRMRLSGSTGGSNVDAELERFADNLRSELTKNKRSEQKILSAKENQNNIEEIERRKFIQDNKVGLIQQFTKRIRDKQPPRFGDEIPEGWKSDQEIVSMVDKKITEFFNLSENLEEAKTALWAILNRR